MKLDSRVLFNNLNSNLYNDLSKDKKINKNIIIENIRMDIQRQRIIEILLLIIRTLIILFIILMLSKPVIKSKSFSSSMSKLSEVLIIYGKIFPDNKPLWTFSIFVI